jgi:hypothetical protein
MATPPVFTSGAILTAAQMNAVGMWKVTPTSVSGTGVSLSGSNVIMSGASEIIVDGCFSSDYRDYLIMCDFFSAQEEAFTLQYRASGSTTATGYNYSLLVFTSGTPGGGGSTSQTSMRIGATAASTYSSFEAKIFAPNVASVTTRHISTFNAKNSASTEFCSGTQTATTQFTGFRTNLAGGSITGTLQVYGYN